MEMLISITHPTTTAISLSYAVLNVCLGNSGVAWFIMFGRTSWSQEYIVHPQKKRLPFKMYEDVQYKWWITS